MQRLIVTSATYRQSSKVTPALLEKDPENRLLARGPRVRLPAEMIRDTALAASGLLNDRIGGPSVLPYQPKGSGRRWRSATASRGRRTSRATGRDLYRRGMYTLWKRTVPPASLATFDAPDREKCTARRALTNTPLQALALLNDPTYVEAARGRWRSARCSKAAPTPDVGSRTRSASRRRASRPARRSTSCARCWTAAWRRSGGIRTAAVKLLAVGESPRDRRLDPSSLPPGRRSRA